MKFLRFRGPGEMRAALRWWVPSSRSVSSRFHSRNRDGHLQGEEALMNIYEGRSFPKEKASEEKACNFPEKEVLVEKAITNAGIKSDISGAKRIFEQELLNRRRDPQYLYRAMMAVYAKREMVKEIVHLLSRMSREGVTKNVFIYNTAIKAAVRRVDIAEKLFEEMMENKLVPDEITYATMIRVLALDTSGSRGDRKSKLNVRLSRIEGLWQGMIERGVFPSSLLYFELMYACYILGRKDKAEKLFWIADKVDKLRLPSCSLMIKIRIERRQSPLPILELMQQKGFQPNGYTFSALAHACAQTRDAQVARKLFSMVRDPKIETYGSLMKCLVAASDVEGAKKLLDDAADKGLQLNREIFATLIQAYVEKADLQEVQKLIARAEQTLEVLPNKVVFNTQLLSTLIKLDRMSEAEELFSTMCDEKSVDIVACITLAKAYASRSNETMLLSLINRLQTEKILDNLESVHNVLVGFFIRSGRIQDAKKVLSRIQEEVTAPSIYFYSLLAKVRFLEMDIKGLQAIAKEVEERQIPAEKAFYGPLIRYAIDLGDLKLAQHVHNQARRRGITCPSIWRDLIRAYIDANLSDEAEMLARSMKEHSRGGREDVGAQLAYAKKSKHARN